MPASCMAQQLSMVMAPELSWLCSEDATIKTNPASWPGLWGKLVADIVKDPPSKNRVFVDLLNEPDHAGLLWPVVSAHCLLALR